MRSIVVLLLALLVLAGDAFADSPTYPPIFNEGWQFWAKWTVVGVGALALDKPLHQLAVKSSLHNSGSDWYADQIGRFGEAPPYLIATGYFLIDGLAGKNTKSLQVARDVVIGSFTTNVVSGSAKKLFGRERPFVTNSPGRFFQGGDSFVSGHTTSAFTLATILAKHYPDGEVPKIAYIIAGLVGVQRVYRNHHWASDVVFGAMGGYAAGSGAIWLGKKLDDLNWDIAPGNPTTVSVRY